MILGNGDSIWYYLSFLGPYLNATQTCFQKKNVDNMLKYMELGCL